MYTKEEVRTTIDYCATGDNIVVDPKITDKTESGIELIGKAKEDSKTDFPEVVSIGEKVTSVNIGDMLAIDGTCVSNLINVNGKKYFSIKEYQVLGKLFKKPVN